MIFFQDTQKTMAGLILEAKQYASLQKQAVQRDTAQVLTRLLAAVAKGVVVALLLNSALFFLCCGLAYFLAQTLGSTALGFAIVAVIIVVVLSVVWTNRSRWIVWPILRTVKAIVNPAETADTPQQLTKKLEQSRQNINEQIQALTHPDEARDNRERVARWANWGYTAYEGFRLGSSLLAVLGLLSGKRKKKRKRK